MNYVIGSGPAGVAAASALVERGQPVTMLDAGGELEPEVQAAVDRLAARPPEEWTQQERASVQGARLRYNSEGAPLKLSFGSDYAYRDVDRLQPVATNGVDAYRAFAAGGLSVLWGASILPFSDADFEQWPLSAAEMRPHYVSALQMTGLAAGEDALSQIYPLLVAPTTLALSTQARSVMDQATQHEAELEREGIYVGRARLAIAQPTASGQTCVYCGMCMYGCPYGLIYSTQSTLRTRLMPRETFTYVPGLVIRRVTERGGCVVIDAVARDTREARTFEASRVFLAAGALGSTAILLDSAPEPAPVVLRQSDHFLVPLLLREYSGRVATERLHTLSQLFIEILDSSISRHGVHLQLYTYSDFFPRMARDRLGMFYPAVAPIVERLLARVVVLKGYLHSDESSGIGATLQRRPGGSALRLEAIHSLRSREVIRGVLSLVKRNRRRLGISPIRLGRRIGRPGSGVHVGGSFPMRRSPVDFESDMFGRPVGFERVHAVDSTVFPTLPAAPPTLTVMANAYRIASEVARGLATN